MSTIRGVKDRRFKFVQLLNSMFEDTQLTLKAKGFIGYCLTKKEDWKFRMTHLVTVLKEKETAIYSTINECIANGYAFRYQTRNSSGEFGEWETIISDSKDEIEILKKEIFEDPNFKYILPDPGFPDAVNPDAEDLPHSNTVATEQYEKQQQQQPVAVAVFSNQIYECLKPLNLPDEEKAWLCQAYNEQTVINAIGWATHQDNPPTKCLAASIKYACKRNLNAQAFDSPKRGSLPIRDELDFEEIMANKAFAEIWLKKNWKDEKKHGRVCTLVRCDVEYVRIMNDSIYFKETKFKEMFEHCLRKLE